MKGLTLGRTRGKQGKLSGFNFLKKTRVVRVKFSGGNIKVKTDFPVDGDGETFSFPLRNEKQLLLTVEVELEVAGFFPLFFYLKKIENSSGKKFSPVRSLPALFHSPVGDPKKTVLLNKLIILSCPNSWKRNGLLL